MGPGCRRLVLRGYSRGFGSAGKTSRNLLAVSGDVSLRRIRPAKNLHISAGIFDKGAAAFNPVSVVQIKYIADLADLGMVDMAAHHAVHASASRLRDHGFLTRDARMVERKKYGHKKARKSFQFSKR